MSHRDFIEACVMIMDTDTVALFISPHLDDAILSCGGTINRFGEQGGRIIIATIFTTDYKGQEPLSELARTNLRVWGLGESSFVKRCEEDRLAANHLGAQVEHFGFQDCIFRQDEEGRFLYTQRVIDVPVHPFDWKNLEPALKEALGSLFHRYAGQHLRIFCPLALGAHVDHILVRHAVESLVSPQEILYYEEFPYALRSNVGENQMKSMDPYTVNISDQDLQARLTASSYYASQIPGLFPSQREMLHEIMDAHLPASRRIYPIRFNVPASIRRMNAIIRKYSERIGGERYWTVGAQPIVLEGHGS
jgi:LmbE family N-acetylglucosaminyl deacetylase